MMSDGLLVERWKLRVCAILELQVCTERLVLELSVEGLLIRGIGSFADCFSSLVYLVLEVLGVKLFDLGLLLVVGIYEIGLVMVIWWDIQAHWRNLLVLMLLLKADLLEVSVLVGYVGHRISKALSVDGHRLLFGGLDSRVCLVGEFVIREVHHV